jgi:hypothetical protein
MNPETIKTLMANPQSFAGLKDALHHWQPESQPSNNNTAHHHQQTH